MSLKILVNMPKITINSSIAAAALGNYIIKENLLVKEASCDRSIEKKYMPDDDEDDEFTRIQLTLGVGSYLFTYKGNNYTYNKVQMGEPLTSTAFDKDATIYEETFVEGTADNIAEEIMELTTLAMKETKRDGYIKTYSYQPKSNYWEFESTIPERSFSSVVLDKDLKKSILNDVNDFTNPDTKSWYYTHGINYRRCYLLAGPPGSGKSSCVKAITSHLKRNIHRIDLGDPNLTDSSLLCAVNSVDKSAVIVFEDIDCLFDSNRNKLDDLNITFSGLLNSLDGICVSRGQIFIATTNYVDRLDQALKRKGRVDRIFQFNYATKEQAKQMFLRFYPNEEELSNKFADCIGPKVATSDLQHHFIMNRKKSAEDASKYVQDKYDDKFEAMYG